VKNRASTFGRNAKIYYLQLADDQGCLTQSLILFFARGDQRALLTSPMPAHAKQHQVLLWENLKFRRLQPGAVTCAAMLAEVAELMSHPQKMDARATAKWRAHAEGEWRDRRYNAETR